MKLECPRCGSKNVLFTKGTQEYWCRRCGAEWPKLKVKEGESR